MTYPTAKRLPLPEIGPNAWIELENPWMLPGIKPLPAHLRGPDVDQDALTVEMERRGKEMGQMMVRAWNGLYDLKTGEPLPNPRENPDVWDGDIPQIVYVKIRRAYEAMQADAEWDPTKPATPATPPPTPTLTPNPEPSPSSPETSTA